MEFQNFSLINFERTHRVTGGQTEVICPFSFLAQSSQTLKNDWSWNLLHDDWHQKHCWLPITSVIPNFLVVVAVGHGRPLIYTSIKTYIKFRLWPNLHAVLRLYFICCQTTSGVPNIVGWLTARSKLSMKSVGLHIARGKLVCEFNFHKEGVNLPCHLYKRNKN